MLNIDAILKKNNLSKQDLAKKMEISRENLWRIINGNPTLQNIEKLANVLGVPIWELFSERSGSSENTLNGFIEFKGTIFKIQSFDDLKKLLDLREQA